MKFDVKFSARPDSFNVTFDEKTNEYRVLGSLRGDDGSSAYEIAVAHGFKGSVEEWLQSLQGITPVKGVDYFTAEEKKEFDKTRIKAIYADAGMSEVEIELALGLVGDDSAKNLETAKKFAEARKAANEAAEKKFKEDLQNHTPSPNGGDPNGGGEKSVGERQAERFAKVEKVNDYVDLSGGGKE